MSVIWQYYKNKDGKNQVENGYNTIYTNGLSEIELNPGETVEVHLILKVKKTIIDNIEHKVQ